VIKKCKAVTEENLKINTLKFMSTRYFPNLLIILVLAACSETEQEGILWLEQQPQLEQDENGYFHLTILRSSWQTTHRISGILTVDGEPAELLRVEWTSSHYWKLDDTLGYYIEYVLTDLLEYVALDTTYITGFDDFLVPTINCCSYSNAEGEVNTMIAPVRSMIGDTMTVGIQFNGDEPIGEIFIVLD
jgi:hypothetical protein